MDNLYTAYRQCIRNKKDTGNALAFEMHREENLVRLLRELQTETYTISRHICFVVKNPVPREIFASHFRDRVVQHLLYNEIEEIFEQQFSPHTYANRVGKGTHRAFKKARFFIARGGKNRQKLHYLKMDIKNFFRSVHKETLWNLMSREITKQKQPELWKTEVLMLLRIIIFHNPAEDYYFKGEAWTKKLIRKEKSLLSGDATRGLPIGNITSQLFANIYLHHMDMFIEQTLGITRYVRYVDDFILFDENRDDLQENIYKIQGFLHEHLLIKVCEDKTILSSIGQGVDFLGYYLKPTHTLVRRKVVKRFKRALYHVSESKAFDNLLTSYCGHCSHAHSFNLLSTVALQLFLTSSSFKEEPPDVSSE